MSSDLPTITDHALIRYMERVMGLDFTSIRAEIEAITALGTELGASSVRHGEFRFVLSNGRVVTVLRSDGGRSHLPRAAWEIEHG